MALIAAIVIAAVAVARSALLALRRRGRRTSTRRLRAPLLVGAATVALLDPFVLGAIRIARALGVALAAEALPAPGGERELDLAAAPRRALLVTLQIAILLVAGVPLIAMTQPFMPGIPGMAILVVGVLLLIMPLWRSATNLQGHVRAGAQVLLEALAAQSAAPAVAGQSKTTTGSHAPLLPGLGNATTGPDSSPAPPPSGARSSRSTCAG